KDIIQVNNVHGKNILNVILNCAKRLNINNEKLKNGLIMINNNYLFRVYSDPIKNSNDKSAKKARLAFNAFGTDTESATSSSTNNSRNDRWRRNGNQRQNELEHYKSQFEALQSETNRGRIAKPERKANKYLNRVNHDEDELLHYPLEEYNSEYDSRNIIGRHEAQHAVSNIYGVQLEDYSFGGEFNPDQKSDMHNKIETIEEINNAANHMIQNEMAQLSIPHEDKSIISNYQVLFKFVKDNNFEIVSNKYKENYSSAITDFRENITDQQKKIYDDTVELLKSKSDENPYLRFRSESDIDLILGNETIELCTNQRHFTKIQNQMT
ncbi:6620_t:CDS:2, partial [Rhizophagus irregularis]